MQLVLAIVSGLLYFFGSAQIGYCFAEGFAWMPLVQAVVFGAITGQMTQARSERYSYSNWCWR